MPRAYLRWAGSKRALLRHILPLLPEAYRVYREPFFGSGALFFLLQPTHAVLSDACIELMETHRAVRDNASAVIRFLGPLIPDRDLFYSIRANRSSGRFKRAAEFIYLNKVCWNGLYRVNSAGEFNVPFGRPKSTFIVDFENLRQCSAALHRRNVRIKDGDFEKCLEGTKAGDLVFLDPPYVTRHNNNGFVDYNETLFSWSDQIRLANLAVELANHGTNVVVANANHKEVIRLYPGFRKKEIQRQSTLASSSRFRGTVSELVLYSLNERGV